MKASNQASKTTALMAMIATVLAVGVAGLPSARAVDDDIFSAEELSKPDTSTPVQTNKLKTEDFGKLDDKSQGLSMDGNLNEADQLANEEVARQTTAEAETLKKDIKTLEKQVNSLKSGAERSKKKAELAFKKLELFKKQGVDARTRLVQSEKDKKRADAKLMQVLEQAKTTQLKVNEARAKTKAFNEEIRKAERENAELNRTLKRAQAQLEREQKTRQKQREKQARLAKDRKRLRADLSRTEKRAGRRNS